MHKIKKEVIESAFKIDYKKLALEVVALQEAKDKEKEKKEELKNLNKTKKEFYKNTPFKHFAEFLNTNIEEFEKTDIFYDNMHYLKFENPTLLEKFIEIKEELISKYFNSDQYNEYGFNQN